MNNNLKETAKAIVDRLVPIEGLCAEDKVTMDKFWKTLDRINELTHGDLFNGELLIKMESENFGYFSVQGKINNTYTEAPKDKHFHNSLDTSEPKDKVEIEIPDGS